uniref:Neuromedin-S n=1 Tax=Geotrypetes seraphini TaxID=260995 RepID=A0A6P8RJU3_GEOSA|nr:neuromedin-S [Geotrypetes seraphini]
MFGFPQPFLRYADGLNLPQSERLALCFSQWTALSNHPQISSFAMDLCSSIFNNLQGIEDNTSTLGRPFFLFRPRNGRKAEDDDP